MALRYQLLTNDGAARRGRVATPRGTFETPVFMPVGTRGAVVHLDAGDYADLGMEVVLGNTYHLMLRPGADVIDELGGLHRFADWDGHMLTDSGGYQVMSLSEHVSIDDDGVTFQSTYDGARVSFTPEDAVRTQQLIGADIQMVLDVCTMLPAPEREVRRAMELTHDWARRARAVHDREGQALFGIVQGGADVGMRQHSAEVLAELDFPGYGVGGLSVGEDPVDRGPALAAALEVLPPDKPRYLMGVGDPVSIVDAIGAGIDMFDCVLPTRLARHGTVLTSTGRMNLRNARFARDAAPIDEHNPASRRWSRAYLRHLLQVREPTAGRILSLHNLWFLLDLVAQARQAIVEERFASFRADVHEVWNR